MESTDPSSEHLIFNIQVFTWSTVSGIYFRIIWGVFAMKNWGAMGAWTAYVWSVTLAGLAIHPYQSVKRMVLNKPILLPVTLSPVLALVGLFVVGRVGSYIFTLGIIGRELMAIVLGSTLIGFLMWQGLILFLVVRFWRARLE